MHDLMLKTPPPPHHSSMSKIPAAFPFDSGAFVQVDGASVSIPLQTQPIEKKGVKMSLIN